jgi:protein-tyrosine phosphatase
MVATPHSNDEYSYDRTYLEGLLDELRARTGASLTFSLGCDFHFSYENLAALEQDSSRFLISGTQYLLVEFSDFSIAPWITRKLEHLLALGIQPIVTHPERNLILQKRPEQVLQWASMGCAIQVTANSLTGRWGDRALKIADWLLRRNVVHIVATDCHNVEHRPPVLSEARAVLEKRYGAETANALVLDNPAAVVENRPLPYVAEV